MYVVSKAYPRSPMSLKVSDLGYICGRRDTQQVPVSRTYTFTRMYSYTHKQKNSSSTRISSLNSRLKFFCKINK